MPRQRPRREYLEAKNCYVGQTVYWIMWYDPDGKVAEDGKHTAWYNYRPGLRPEIWARKIERLTPKTISVEGIGRIKSFVYACPQDAITAEYESFCRWRLNSGGIYGYGDLGLISLGEASAFLQLLARLEFDLNSETRFAEKIEEQNANDS